MLVALLLLMIVSGFFSGSEAAFFSLTARDRRRLVKKSAGGRMVDAMLGDPERLLSAILFWNLLVNMLYFAIVAILATEVDRPGVLTMIALVAIIFFSEMLPKSFAVIRPGPIAIASVVPLRVALAVVSPVLPVVKHLNAAAGRLIWPTFEPEPELRTDDLRRAIDLGTGDLKMMRRQREALQSIIDLAEIRVDEIMRPRSKLAFAAMPLSLESVPQPLPPGGYLMVAPSTDRIEEPPTGSLAVRSLRPSAWDHLHDSIKPVLYVPWSARAAHVFDKLEAADRDVAVVVDEFGDMMGATSVDDILRGVLASRARIDEASDQIQRLGADHYKLHGSTGLGTLARRLDVDLPDDRPATVAGHLQRHNARLPRVGDVAPLDKFELVVIEEADDGVWIEVWRGPDAENPS